MSKSKSNKPANTSANTNSAPAHKDHCVEVDFGIKGRFDLNAIVEAAKEAAGVFLLRDEAIRAQNLQIGLSYAKALHAFADRGMTLFENACADDLEGNRLRRAELAKVSADAKKVATKAKKAAKKAKKSAKKADDMRSDTSLNYATPHAYPSPAEAQEARKRSNGVAKS